jgi:hypothetical protein
VSTDGPAQPPPDRPDAISLQRWASARPLAVLGAWLVLVVVAVLVARERLVVQGGVEALLPVAHRQPADEPLVLLQVDEDAAGDATVPLSAAADRIATALPRERVPIAPPAPEAAAWFDAHAFFLVADDALTAIRERLSDEAVADAIEDLRARMSSPLFGVAGDQPRRDPLTLHPHLDDRTGRFSSTVGPGGSIVTAAGDLLASDRRALLLQLRTDRPRALVIEDVRKAVGDGGITASWAGPARLDDDARSVIADRGLVLVGTVLAAIAAILAAALRSVRATFVVVACLAGSVAMIGAAAGEVDLWGLALVIAALGFVVEAALPLQRISARGWPGALVLATAMLPLLLSPYPAWQAHAWRWTIVVALAIVPLRAVVPAFHARFGGGVSWADRGATWSPQPTMAALLGLLALAGGVIGAGSLAYRGVDRPSLGDIGGAPDRRLTESFFDPSLVVRATSTGDDPAAALERAALDARALASLVPQQAQRIDSPGLWVARAADLEARRAALVALGLPERLEHLRATLEARGFRSDAFGEFLRGAAVTDGAPTGEAMLAGPLGPWLRRYLRDGPPVQVHAQVVLEGDPEAAVPAVKDHEGNPIRLVGPAIAARHDRVDFRDWLGIYALCQMWLGAFIVWLGARSLSIAVSAAFATLATQCAVLALLSALRIPVGPAMLPALLLVGAAATTAAGRACRAVDLGRPLFASGIIVTNLCQVAAGTVLLLSGIALWRTMGLVVVLGAFTASCVGLFVAPGVCRMIRRLAGGSTKESAS